MKAGVLQQLHLWCESLRWCMERLSARYTHIHDLTPCFIDLFVQLCSCSYMGRSFVCCVVTSQRCWPFAFHTHLDYKHLSCSVCLSPPSRIPPPSALCCTIFAKMIIFNHFQLVHCRSLRGVPGLSTHFVTMYRWSRCQY